MNINLVGKYRGSAMDAVTTFTRRMPNASNEYSIAYSGAVFFIGFLSLFVASLSPFGNEIAAATTETYHMPALVGGGVLGAMGGILAGRISESDVAAGIAHAVGGYLFGLTLFVFAITLLLWVAILGLVVLSVAVVAWDSLSTTSAPSASQAMNNNIVLGLAAIIVLYQRVLLEAAMVIGQLVVVSAVCAVVCTAIERSILGPSDPA
jgi:hypothetical protein